MPHKVNPIDFENAGNLGLAIAVAEHLAHKLAHGHGSSAT